MMEKSLYFAYGSNINLDQMQYRCPDASVYGQAVLDNYDLRFRGSGVATVEPKESACVYGLLWELTDKCEASLDRYEGYPNFYYKRELKVKYKGIRTGKHRTVTAFVYIMHEERPIGVPSDFYMDTCLEGYDTFYFDPGILLAAYDKSLEVCGYERK